MSEPRGIGDNQPPHDADLARERVEALVATAERWTAEWPEIADAETAGRCTDFIDQLAAEGKKLDAQWRAEKAPILDAERAIARRWEPLVDMIKVCRLLLISRRAAWLKSEGERLAAERALKAAAAKDAAAKATEAAQRAADRHSVQAMTDASWAARAAQEAAAAAAAVPDRARTRGQITGRVASLRRTWRASVVDWVAAMRHYRDRAEVRSLIERLANADARAGIREIPGCVCYQEEN